MKNKDINKITLSGILAALSIIAVLLIRFPIILSAPYLEYDAADVPIMIGAFILGPVWGIAILLVSSLIQAFLLGGNGLIGFIMHFVASGCLVVVASFIYRRKKTFEFMVIGLIAGAIIRVGVMIPLNLLLTPIMFGMPVDSVKELIIPVIIPFNLIKDGINSAISLVVFPLIKKILRINNQ